MWTLTLFGAPALTGPDGSAHIARRKAWALLAFLAATQQRQSRETLAALLWPEYDEGAARADLSRTLRKATAPELFLADRDNIMIAPQAELWVDVRHFDNLLLAAHAAGGAASDEQVQRRLIQLYAANGQLAEAIRQYETCRRLLAEELGVAPQPQTMQLFEDIRARRYPAPLSPAPADTMPVVGIKGDPPPFVTREAEIKRMEDCLHAALQADGSLLFIIGGAGRGKTTLMQEFVRRALQTHLDLVAVGGSGKAWGGIGDAYLPFRELLGLLGGDVASPYGQTFASLEQARRLWAIMPLTAQAILEHGPQLLDLFIAVSPLSARLRSAGHPGVEWPATLQSEGGRRETGTEPAQQSALLGQYVNVLHQLAQQYPLLIILDDLQWFDDASTALLFQLGRQLRGSRIFIIGAYRPDELSPTVEDPSHPITQIVAEFTRDYGDITVDLARSDGDAGRRFVDAYLDTEQNDLDASFRQALSQKTAGTHSLP